MTNVQGESQRAGAKTEFDAVIIGAGFSGMYMLHSLRDKLDLNVTVFEAGDGVGGTWYWNRYPGARCDSDSYIYCYTFDKNLLQEWNWSERYPEQDEILRYLEHCAERFDLKPDIQFGKRVVEVVFDEGTELWTVRTDKGDVVTARFVITAVGALSTANMPSYKGFESFKGKCYHTSQWPHDGVDFTAKRVGVIGTGATAVQAIPEIAQQAKHLTVFQRTPNFCVPARNGRVDPEVTKARKADYDGVRQRIKNSFFGFELNFIPKSALETTPEEREQEFDKMWDAGGFAFWLANYEDMFFSKEANDVIADYLKRKIRSIVNDSVTADKLTPKTYPYGTKRQPLDTNYFETFNKKNVELVDATADGPIEEITPNGIRAGGREYPLDIIVIATGFDALTGPLKNLGIKGARGQGAGAGVGGRPADLPRPGHRRLPEPIHDHRPAEPLGAVEHAGVDRAARRVDQRMHRPHATKQACNDRGNAAGARRVGRPCRRGSELDPDAWHQFLVHGSQHRRQGAPLLALSRPGRRRRIPQEVRGGR
jgi:cyclohexanone monooxygenase